MKWVSLIVVLLATLVSASANVKRGFLSNTGSAQYNMGDPDQIGALMNSIDTISQLGLAGTASVAQMDANGYPNTTLTSGQKVTYQISFDPTWTTSGIQWTFDWTPGGAAQYFIATNATNISFTNAGCTATGGSGLIITYTASARCTFTFNWTGNPSFNISTEFRAAVYAPGSNKMILARSSDIAAITAGKIVSTEYQTLIKNANIRTLRFMPQMINELANAVKWAYRTTPNTIGYNHKLFPPTAWSGGAGTVGTPTQIGDAYTLTPATDSPSDWTDGEVIQANMTLATTNSTTSPTLTITGHTGAKTIVQLTGNAVSIGGIKVGTTNCNIFAFCTATFIYDSVLNAVLYLEGGISGGLSTEYQVEMANELNVNMWTNIPAHADDNYVTNAGNYIATNLNPWLTVYVEYINEVWNYVFGWTTWQDNRTLAMGLPGEGFNGSFYALRSRIIMGNLASIFSGQSSRLKRLLCIQSVAPISSQNTYRLQGYGLAPNGTGTGGSGNSVYNTYTGSANYSQTVGSGGLGRPIDFADVICPASYTGGQIFQGDDNFLNITQANVNSLQTAINDYAAGSTAAAFAIIDNDFRQGTVDQETVTASGATLTLTNSQTVATTTSTVATATGVLSPKSLPLGAAITDSAGNLQSGTTISSVTGSYGNYTVNLSKTATGSGSTNLVPMEFSVGSPVVFTTTGTLPAGLSLNTPYFVISTSGVTFQVSATPGGSAITTTNAGSGAHTVGRIDDGSFPMLWEVCCEYGSNNSTFSGIQNVIISGSYNVSVEAYEGGLGTSFPTTAECTSMGVTATPQGGGGATAAGCSYQSQQLLTAYLNSSMAQTLAGNLFNQFVGTDPAAKNFGLLNSTSKWTPSWFTLSNPLGTTGSWGPWAALPGYIDSTPYQTYNGVAGYRHP